MGHQRLENHQHRVSSAGGSSPNPPCSVPRAARRASNSARDTLLLLFSAVGVCSGIRVTTGNEPKLSSVTDTEGWPGHLCKHRHFSLPTAQSRLSVLPPLTRPNTGPLPWPPSLSIRNPPVSQPKPRRGPCRLPSPGGLPGPERREGAGAPPPALQNHGIS